MVFLVRLDLKRYQADVKISFLSEKSGTSLYGQPGRFVEQNGYGFVWKLKKSMYGF